MTIMISSAVHEDWCAFAGSRLTAMGVQKPLSGERSGLAPTALAQKMHLASGAPNDVFNNVAPQNLGQTWSIAAAEVVLANAEQEVWGWADPLNLPFMEFWKEFDPRCRFVLVYGSPAKYISSEITRSADAIDRVDHILKRWTSFHSSMLSFYQQNQDRCILTDIRGFDGSAAPVAETLTQKFDINASALDHSEYCAETPTLEIISERIMAPRHEQTELFSELQNSADIAIGASSNSNRGLSEKAIEEQLAMRAETGAQIATIGSQHAKIAELERQIAEHETRIQQLLENAETRTDANSTLYKRQLDQVRDELHYYYSKYSELSAPAASGRVMNEPASSNTQSPSAHASSVLIDLGSFVDGAGWHQPEERGRWAGAESRSTCNIPALRPGKYRVTARILDSMGLEILRSMKIELNGVNLNARLKILCDMGGRLAPLRRAKAGFNNVENPFPASLVASIRAHNLSNSGPNELAIISELVRSPSAVSGDDDRLLSCFFENIEIVRVD
ncbi:MAG: hypothetical protein JJ931_00865 [Henriciella sp.]|nr:hypothetical protein [Henriciella sp.]MBO6693949.1 hypothetical protein [Henriciella sp.]